MTIELKLKNIKATLLTLHLKELGYFCLYFSPILLLIAFNLLLTYQNMTRAALEKRQGLSYLLAANINAQLNSFVDLGESIVSRQDFKDKVASGQWEEAIQLINSVPKNFTSIDRVVLVNPQAVLMADYPQNFNLVGQSFAFRNWYKEVSKDWQPHVSDVYKRSGEPKYNIVSIVVPVKSDSGEILGILLLQIKLDSLYNWVKNINLRDEGIVYITDQRGQIVVHPKISPQDEIVDYSSVDVVSSVLRGENGITRFFDPVIAEDQIVTYQPISDFKWGVFTGESPHKIFAARNTIFAQLLFVDIVLLIVYAVGLLLLLSAFSWLRSYSKSLEEQVAQRTQKIETFKLAVENSSNHIIITNSDGIITYANKAVETVTGYSLDEVLGKTPKVWGNQMPEKFYSSLWKTIRDDRLPFVGEITNRRKNGEKYTALIRISPIFNESKELVGYIGIEEDISSRKKLDDQLAQKVHELERANRLMVGRELKMIELKKKLATKENNGE